MELQKAIATRQSCRDFLPDAVKEEDIEKILLAGCAAPIGGAEFQNMHLTVVKNQALLGRLTALTAVAFKNPDFKPFYGATTFIVVSTKPKESEPNMEYANAACVVENMLLAATDLGLGNVYLWSFLWGIKEDPSVVAQLNLPEGFSPTSGIAVGYAKNPAAPRELSMKFGVNRVE